MMKDLPPHTSLAKFDHALYMHTQASIPLPALTHRDGFSNLLAHVPDAPDFQGKLYLAVNMASGTDFHCDVADAANTATSACPDGKLQSCAQAEAVYTCAHTWP